MRSSGIARQVIRGTCAVYDARASDGASAFMRTGSTQPSRTSSRTIRFCWRWLTRVVVFRHAPLGHNVSRDDQVTELPLGSGSGASSIVKIGVPDALQVNAKTARSPTPRLYQRQACVTPSKMEGSPR